MITNLKSLYYAIRARLASSEEDVFRWKVLKFTNDANVVADRLCRRCLQK